MDLWEVIIVTLNHRTINFPPFQLMVDNDPMHRVLKSGRNPTMKSLHRVHRVDVAWLHERVGNPATADNVVAYWCDTKTQKADLHTKSFKNPADWEPVRTNINIVPKEDIFAHIQRVNENKKNENLQVCVKAPETVSLE